MEPKLLFERFEEICKVPRESGNEIGMQRYLEQFAAAHGLHAAADATGNVVIQVPARGTGAGKPPVILQSHTDMVCVKTPDSTHDFTKDPIQLHTEERDEHGDGVLQPVLMANRTTLGADNGLGVAAALAAATDIDITDAPPLELLFTVDEERGLTGAATLNPDLLMGSRLINMDSEELGEICISCAGGRDLTAQWSVDRIVGDSDKAALTVSLTGLPGGHSGVQINEGRGNAIQLLIAELLSQLNGESFGLVSIMGGSKRNVIPSTAEITLLVDAGSYDRLYAGLSSAATLQRIAAQVQVGAELIELRVTKSDVEAGQQPISDSQSLEIVNAIVALPWGPQSMSPHVPGLVETSNNVAVISTTESEITLCCSTRSSRQAAIAEFQWSITPPLVASGAIVSHSDGYPGWEADPDNPLRKQAEETFTRVLGFAPKITAIHAGLECGVLKGIMPQLKMISFGPSILDAHTALERVLLNTVPPFYACLKELLQDLAHSL